jgi:hypothetical protein
MTTMIFPGHGWTTYKLRISRHSDGTPHAIIECPVSLTDSDKKLVKDWMESLKDETKPQPTNDR